nr:AAA family ATPase [Sneathiella chinensis]
MRLSGFKSFVEPTELLIKDGLTGIVGPNGCGKSNLVEALRWVMGETSAKNMRGGAMDDVIFAGTTSRPPRNMAEVTLSLDNHKREAPPAYNDLAELDITRRIRRDTGSDYRIGGKVTRARDVQLLFADLATGAHSTAIVSQGRVGSLINAKPKDRRHLLEEAAGISGLHSRRHEAELRLKNAEINLERVDDVTGQLEVQLNSLKRQARQATRYRNISGHIRKAEAMLFFRKYEQAFEAEQTAKKKLEETSFAVAELTKQTAIAETASLKAAEALTPLRNAEASAAAKVQRLTLERENLDAEEERLKKAKKQLEDRKLQISSDMEREKSLEKDAADAAERLAREKTDLTRLAEQEAPKLEALQTSIQEQQSIVRAVQADFDLQTEKLASEKARQNSLLQQLKNLEQAANRLKTRITDLEKEKLVLEHSLETLEKESGLDGEIKQAIAAAEALTARLNSLDTEKQSADTRVREARQSASAAEQAVTAVQTEIKTLQSLLETDEEGNWSPVAESLKVVKGFETALGAALGDDLEAPTDPAAPAFWHPPPSAGHAPAPFPAGIETLDQYVDGNVALDLRLSHVGLVTPEDGPLLAQSLQPGQRLVSKQGDLWRWDGFTRKAGAKTAATVRLEQRNRLLSLEKDRQALETVREQAQDTLRAAENTLQTLIDQEKSFRGDRRQQEQVLSDLRSRQAEHSRTLAAKQSRLTSLQESASALSREYREGQEQFSLLNGELTGLPDIGAEQAALDSLKNSLREKRESLGNIRSDHDRLLRESAIRRDRLASIDQERQGWLQRSENMVQHFGQLEIRFSSTEQELQELADRPAQLAEKRGILMDEIARAEGGRATARDHVAEAESVQQQCDRALRDCQDALGACREERVRHQADVEHAADTLKNLAAQIFDRLECAPERILQVGGIAKDEDIPPIEASERTVERLRKERDGMGPVNLRAEIEAREVDEQLTTLQKEREDLEAAIARLRQGIASLNREGRERLLAAFTQVDAHFQELFKRVFGGGHAHLTLTESDDPLAAGLEIMASPPGKRLQLMSLLSGGEQALTAVALLFAVFLTNPAPICVLDEVDAPLDDVNVERLCNLLDSIREHSDTRFLVVTHHPITMARMDRLYGVTMAERGISQLVSVDLTKAQLMTNEVT